jgi:hypothetical protein
MSAHSSLSGRISLLFVIVASLALSQSAARAQSSQFTFNTQIKAGSASTASAPNTTSPLTTAAITSDTFENFVRFPAEEQTFLQMQNNTAYFRDFFTGGETFSDGANDGDTLSATVTDPNGVLIGSFAPITFHATFNGQTDCWVGGFPAVTLCGATSIDVIWFFNSQCGTSGNYTMSFSRNSGVFFTGTFNMVPSINPDKVSFIAAPNYNQGNYSTTQYGNFCWITNAKTGKKSTVLCSSLPVGTTQNQVTIQNLGCLLTAYAATLTYQGLNTLPTDLNTWLTNNGGYGAGGAILPWKVVQYAHQNGVNLTFQRQPASGDSSQDGSLLNGILRTPICAKGPTPIHVKHNSATRNHFVTAWGRPQAENTYLLKDPNGGIDVNLNSTAAPSRDYNNIYYGTRELQGTGTTFNFGGGFSITLHSPAELLITDPTGLRTGLNPITNTAFAENPNAAYGDDSIDDPEDLSDSPINISAKTLEVSPVVAGTYSLTVTGTGTGTYDLEFNSFDSNFQNSGTLISGMPVSPGSVQTFQITAPITPGATFPLSGGFDGGGGHEGVNDFLTYGNPTSTESDLPAGTTSFPVLIFYDPGIIANTFTATLNGVDVSTSFNPTPGGFEIVNIPLASGTSNLLMSVSGTFSGHVSTDKDKLVFMVP